MARSKRKLAKLNAHLIFGAAVLGFVILFSAIGPFFVDKDDSLLGSFGEEQPPFWAKQSDRSTVHSDDVSAPICKAVTSSRRWSMRPRRPCWSAY